MYSCIEFDQLERERERESVASLPSNDTQCLQTNIRISLISEPRLRVGTVKQVLLYRIGHSSLQGGSGSSGSGRLSTHPPPLRFDLVDHSSRIHLTVIVSMVTRSIAATTCNATRDTFKRVSGSRLGHRRPTVLSNLSPSSTSSSSLRGHSSQVISADSTLIQRVRFDFEYYNCIIVLIIIFTNVAPND